MKSVEIKIMNCETIEYVSHTMDSNQEFERQDVHRKYDKSSIHEEDHENKLFRVVLSVNNAHSPNIYSVWVFRAWNVKVLSMVWLPLYLLLLLLMLLLLLLLHIMLNTSLACTS